MKLNPSFYERTFAEAMAREGLKGGTYLDALLNFAVPTISNTTKTVSSNVYDHQAAGMVFGGRQPLWCFWQIDFTGTSTSPTALVEIWAGDAADGDIDDNQAVLNDILGSSGIVRGLPRSGAALDQTSVAYGSFPIGTAPRARRYYGANFTLGGTNPDAVAASSFCRIVRDAQSNQLI